MKHLRRLIWHIASRLLIVTLVLGMMGVPPELMPDATTYMRMSCIGVPLVAVYNYSSSMLRSLGDSKTPLYLLIFSCFLNNRTTTIYAVTIQEISYNRYSFSFKEDRKEKRPIFKNQTFWKLCLAFIYKTFSI